MAYEGETPPPLGLKCASDRPRTIRIMRQSCHALWDNLLISCLNCDQLGHNKRRCSAKPTDKAFLIKSNTNLEAAPHEKTGLRDKLVHIQEENDEDDESTKDERSRTGNT